MFAALLALAVLAQESPIELPLPAGVDASKPFKLVRADDGEEIPAQVLGGSIFFLAPNEKSDVRIVPGEPKSVDNISVVDNGKNLLVEDGCFRILRYNYTTVQPPAGADPVFARSGYIHPLWTPDRTVITNDSPANHLHHHGIWSAWTSSEFDGRKSNFWESKEKQGRDECVKVEDKLSGPVFAGFKATHRFVNLNGPDGEKAVLEEVWQVRVFRPERRFVIDLVSTQTCLTEKPLVIKEYRYGGIGFRGPLDWEGKTGVEFLTSEGKSRIDGHATKAKWCEATGKIGGAEASIGFLCHPSDFRFPQPLRIHPEEPFFNWAVPQGGDFAIEPGKPYVARYRFIVADSVMGADEVESSWKAYAEPPKVSIAAAK